MPLELPAALARVGDDPLFAVPPDREARQRAASGARPRPSGRTPPGGEFISTTLVVVGAVGGGTCRSAARSWVAGVGERRRLRPRWSKSPSHGRPSRRIIHLPRVSGHEQLGELAPAPVARALRGRRRRRGWRPGSP